MRLLSNIRNPLVLLLVALGVVSFLAPADLQNPLDLPNFCFLGSNVESGSATAVVIHTGDRTYFGSLAASIVGERQLTSFDTGVCPAERLPGRRLMTGCCVNSRAAGARRRL